MALTVSSRAKRSTCNNMRWASDIAKILTNHTVEPEEMYQYSNLQAVANFEANICWHMYCHVTSVVAGSVQVWYHAVGTRIMLGFGTYLSGILERRN